MRLDLGPEGKRLTGETPVGPSGEATNIPGMACKTELCWGLSPQSKGLILAQYFAGLGIERRTTPVAEASRLAGVVLISPKLYGEISQGFARYLLRKCKIPLLP